MPLEYMASPLLSHFEVQRYNFYFAFQQSTKLTVNTENRGNLIQGIGYPGNETAKKPTWRKGSNPEIRKSRKPPLMLGKQKMEAVLSEPRE